MFRSGRLMAAAAVAGAAVIGIQFIRPELKNPPVVAEFHASAQVEEILRNSCYNCHSNETKLVWFDKVVPAYWLVASDVKEARSHLNFSELGGKPAAQQIGTLFEAVNQVQLGAMPLPSYLAAHPESRVTTEQLRILRSYLESKEVHRVSSPGDIAAVGEQYASWAGSGASSKGVQPALNGIEFSAGYKDWKAISSTDRVGNGTLREVLGNDVAVKAIQAGEINPWPDGTMFAKVAWYQIADADGSIRPGKFEQVEFMIKDSRKYADTKGWGWARWLDTDLHPFGASAAFTASCVACHLPLQDTDYVFTKPLKGQP
jgi:mono/diheme cytochrome c family protein